MRLTTEDLHLFAAACADQQNAYAQELLNAFGVHSADKVLECLPNAPLSIMSELVSCVWKAIDEARTADRTASHFTIRRATG